MPIQLTKTTNGPATRFVGDTITSTVVLEDISDGVILHFNEEYTKVNRDGWTQNIPTFGFNPLLGGTVPALEWQPGAEAEKTYPCVPGDIFYFETLTSDGLNGGLPGLFYDLYDGATQLVNNQPLIQGAWNSPFIVTGPLRLVIRNSSAGTLGIIDVNAIRTGTDIFDFVENIPAAPAGTTRTWTAVIDSQIVNNFGALAGVGDINKPGIRFVQSYTDVLGGVTTPNPKVTFTINDTVNATGDIVKITSGGGTTSFSDYNTLTPVTWGVDQHNLAFSATGYRATVTSNSNITGIVAQTTGTIILIFNVGTADLRLKNNDVGSTISNRLFLPNAVDIALRNNGSIYLRYDAALNGGSGAWHLINYSRE